MRKKITAIIITLNESEVIADTIKSIKQIADEIIVIDSHSQDATAEIATANGAKVISVDWKGYSNTKNYGISFAKHDWIFCFDADERPDKELIENIKKINPEEGHVYLMNRLTTFVGENVRHGSWHPDWVVRLFNKHECKWNDNLVHESLTPLKDKKKVKLKGYIHHRSIVDQADFDEKIDRYAFLKAKQWVQHKKQPNIFKRIIGPQIRFITSFIIKAGFLDGILGYRIAMGEYNLVKKQLSYFKKFNT